MNVAGLRVILKVRVRMRIANRKKRNDACLDRHPTFFKEMMHNFIRFREFDLQSSLCESLFRGVLQVTHNKRAP